MRRGGDIRRARKYLPAAYAVLSVVEAVANGLGRKAAAGGGLIACGTAARPHVVHPSCRQVCINCGQPIGRQPI